MVTKNRPKGLGLGLEALLGPRVSDAPAAAPRDDGAPSSLKLEQLQPGRYQPRTRMDEGSLYELAESIKSQGVMQPVLVRPLGAQRYEIIAGERRVRAARIAGLAEIPVLVKPVPDEAAAVMALIENIQREDLNPLEEAQGLKRLIDEFKLTHEQAAQAVGRSRSAASNLLRLLNLAAPVQQLLMAGDLEMGHARALLALDAAPQILAANEVAAKAARQVDEPAAAWRVVSMEEGVRLLGGQIRLIDGLSPERVETGPGTAVPGADPSLPLVRVIYASGSVTLDQQRPATQVAARREADTDGAPGATAVASVTAWQERGGIRYVITGSVPADSLRALGARVR